MKTRSVSFLRPVAALLLLFAAVFGSAVDAVACEQQASVFEPVTISAQVIPSDEPSDDQAPQHVCCVHGHCHHIAPMNRSGGFADALPPTAALHFALATAELDETELILFKEPPRA